MSTLIVRPFDRDRDDYDDLARLWNALHPDMPRSGPIWRQRHGSSMHRPEVGMWIALRDGVLVGLAQHDPCDVAGEPGQLQITLVARPEALGGETLDALFAVLMQAMPALSPPSLIAYANDTQPWMVAFYEARGFEAVQSTASSRLLVADFDAARFEPTLTSVAAAGYELMSVADLAEADPDWMRTYFALDRAIMRDIPFQGPVRDVPFESFVKRTKDPTSWNPNATFVARHLTSGTLVGTSLVLTYEPIPGYGFAGITGVLKEHRRRGLACALKIATIAWSRAHGIDRIVALNEVNNPMLQLNLALGFETQHTQHTMLRPMAGA